MDLEMPFRQTGCSESISMPLPGIVYKRLVCLLGARSLPPSPHHLFSSLSANSSERTHVHVLSCAIQRSDWKETQSNFCPTATVRTQPSNSWGIRCFQPPGGSFAIPSPQEPETRPMIWSVPIGCNVSETLEQIPTETVHRFLKLWHMDTDASSH